MSELINRLKTVPLHPLLFAIYPVIFLYAHNFSQVGLSELITPLVFSLSVTILFYAVGAFIFRSTEKAAIFVSLAICLFFFYGHLYDGSKWVIRSISGSPELSTAIIKDRFLLPITFCLIGGWGAFVYFSSKKFTRLSQTLTIIAVILVGINCSIVAGIVLNKSRAVDIVKSKPPLFNVKFPGSVGEKPDIYFITLDEFVGPNTLKNYYRYDPAWFFDFLSEKGFHCIPKSRSNYFETTNCLFTILNMDYIHRNPDYYGKYKVGSLFESMGYRFFNAMPLKSVSNAFYLEMNDAFIMELIHCSMLKSLGQEIQRFNVTYIFNNFHKLVNEKSPKFIHIHILCPHVPFIFDSIGGRLPYGDKENWGNKSIYLGQWIFVANKIESLIDTIFSLSTTKPVIILQSDHGVRSLPRTDRFPPLITDEKGLIYKGTETGKPLDYFQVSSNNVSTFYFPDGNYSDLYDSLTPVNTFRIIFNHFFNTNYTLLPDESFIGPLVTHSTEIKDTINFKNVTRFARW